MTARCPKCRAQLEEWEEAYLRRFGQCRECVRDGQPRCRTCGDTYLMHVHGVCGLCAGDTERAALGVY